MIKNGLFDFSNSRREYSKSKLNRKDLTKTPLDLFENWLKDAYEANLLDPNAMSIATVDSNGQPYQRIVLLKKYNENGLVFYTNSLSRKIQHIIINNKVSLLFPWNQIDRQVCFIGNAEQIFSFEVKKYFYSRPKLNQVATLVSKQSKKIYNKSILNNKFREFKKKFENQKVPFPKFWSGWRVNFYSVEFWQGRNNRLHDRFLYKKENNYWKVYRLSP